MLPCWNWEESDLLWRGHGGLQGVQLHPAGHQLSLELLKLIQLVPLLSEKKSEKPLTSDISSNMHPTVTDSWTHCKPHLSVCNLLSSLHLVLHLSPHCLHFVLRCPSNCHLSGHLCVLRCRRAEKHTKIIETEAGSSVSVRSRRTELYLAFFFFFFFRKREEEVRLVCLTFLSRSAWLWTSSVYFSFSLV